MVFNKFSALVLSALSVSQISEALTDPNFHRYTLDDQADAPAYIQVGDLNNDGIPEVLVSMFGNSPISGGSLAKYTLGSHLGDWKKSKVANFSTRFPNNPTITDVNQDGKLDIILPSGFLACIAFPFGNCGSMTWMEQQSDETFKSHTLLKGQRRFYHHVAFVDWDRDGIKDIVAVGEEKSTFGSESSRLQYFKGNKTPMAFERKPREITKGLGSFPTVLDIDHDGDWEVFSNEYFGSEGSFSWIDRNPDGTWSKYYIDNSVGKSIQFSIVEDLFGEGKRWGVGANHTNTTDQKGAPESAVYLYEFPDFHATSFDPSKPWSKTKISQGIVSVKSESRGPKGAPGVFTVGDVDGDGDKDIVVSGDGDPRIFWLRQEADRSFTTHTLETDMPQGGVAVADLDGDGKNEILASSYDRHVVYIYSHQ